MNIIHYFHNLNITYLQWCVCVHFFLDVNLANWLGEKYLYTFCLFYLRDACHSSNAVLFKITTNVFCFVLFCMLKMCARFFVR